MPESPPPLDGLHVLVVEDDYLIASEVERCLRQAGATVIGPAPTVARADDLIGGRRLDAAVLDIALGEGGAVYPLADRLAALGIPYLFTTGDLRVAEEPDRHGRPRPAKPVLDADLVAGLRLLVASRA